MVHPDYSTETLISLLPYNQQCSSQLPPPPAAPPPNSQTASSSSTCSSPSPSTSSCSSSPSSTSPSSSSPAVPSSVSAASTSHHHLFQHHSKLYSGHQHIHLSQHAHLTPLHHLQTSQQQQQYTTLNNTILSTNPTSSSGNSSRNLNSNLMRGLNPTPIPFEHYHNLKTNKNISSESDINNNNNNNINNNVTNTTSSKIYGNTFLGPNLWDKNDLFQGDKYGVKFEYLDIEDFLNENGLAGAEGEFLNQLEKFDHTNSNGAPVTPQHISKSMNQNSEQSSSSTTGNTSNPNEKHLNNNLIIGNNNINGTGFKNVAPINLAQMRPTRMVNSQIQSSNSLLSHHDFNMPNKNQQENVITSTTSPNPSELTNDNVDWSIHGHPHDHMQLNMPMHDDFTRTRKFSEDELKPQPVNKKSKKPSLITNNTSTISNNTNSNGGMVNMGADLSAIGYNNCNMTSNNINNSNNAAIMRTYSTESSCDEDSLSTLNDDDDMNYFEHLPSPTFGSRERQLLARKRRHQFVPNELKDDKYWARRRKNNMAAKRSRDARRMKENQIALRAAYLERENDALKKQLDECKRETKMLKTKLSRYEHGHDGLSK